MSAIINDARAGTDVDHLLERTAEKLSAELAADHVLIQERRDIHTDSYARASIGWDQSTSLMLGTTFVDWARHPGLAGLEEITINESHLQGSVYVPPAAFLRGQALGAGLFVTLSCGEGGWDGFAGRSAAASAFGESDARLLVVVMTVLSLTGEQEQAELVRRRNLRRVIQAKQEWESTLDGLPQLICLLDEQGNVMRANRILETWNLGQVRSVRGTRVHDMLHPGCRDWQCKLKAKWEAMWQQFTTSEFVECDIYDQILARDLCCSLRRGSKSHYQAGAEKRGYAYLVVEDVSQQKRAERILENYHEELEQRLQERTLELTKTNARLKSEIQDHIRDGEALRESEKRYTCLMDTTLTGFYVLKGSQIVFCNRRFGDIFGYTPEEISRLPIQQLFPPNALGVGAMAAPAEPIDATGLSPGEQIVRGVTKDGNTRWLLRNLTRVDCHDEAMILGNIIDLTKQKVIEDALRCSQCDLQILSEKLITTQEAERKQIAAELHDSIGQSISAVKFGVENALRECGEELPASSRKYLTGAVDKLRATIEEVRKISMDLRPSMLDDLGLIATIGWFCREFRTLFPEVVVDVCTDVEESELPGSLKLTVFRILQEALNNIGKHAKASRVSIALARKGDSLTLEIEDDGLGFAVEAASSGRGFGLGSMRERAKLSRGTLDIESSPGAGTIVRATWPCGQLPL
jgi:PAS domain S-box-containing protein